MAGAGARNLSNPGQEAAFPQVAVAADGDCGVHLGARPFEGVQAWAGP
jgi:hypothetical protein